MPVLVFVFFLLPSQEAISALFLLSLASPSNGRFSSSKTSDFLTSEPVQQAIYGQNIWDPQQ